MARRDEWDAVGGLEARGDDAKLGVHCLSEFVFCPRAGLCLYEQDEEFAEREEHGTGGYLPIYDQVELERILKSVLEQFWTVLVAGGTATIRVRRDRVVHGPDVHLDCSGGRVRGDNPRADRPWVPGVCCDPIPEDMERRTAKIAGS